jgi:hypothetical protein
MRDFTNPTYDGPDCVCCQHLKEDVLKEVIKMLREQDSTCSDWVISLIEKEME